MFSRLWAKITGADKKQTYPDQQANSLGRIGDYTIIFPYGLYADLPDNTLAKMVDCGALVPVTVERPDDLERAEPVFFHPDTNTRIIPRNNGDLDIITQDGFGNVNIVTQTVSIVADTAVSITSPTTTINGDLAVTGTTSLSPDVTSGGTNIGQTHNHAGPMTAPPGPISNTGDPV